MPAHALEPIPEGVNFENAVAFWMAYATADGMIVQAGEMPIDAVGRSVVLTGASSSVGTAAFQMMKQIGAASIATTRTQQKVANLERAGADHVIVTDDEDLGARLRKIKCSSSDVI